MHRHLVIFLLYNFRDFFQDYETDESSWGAEALETSQSRKRRYSGEKKKRRNFWGGKHEMKWKRHLVKKERKINEDLKLKKLPTLTRNDFGFIISVIILA